jgi:uncharacterized membrane protein
MFGLFKRRPVNYFSEEEKQLIVQAIQTAEHRTSGEVRIYIESHCEFVDPVRRAKELFQELKMYETSARNGVLLYVAMKDRQLSVFGDEGIHTKVGNAFWNAEVNKMLSHFNQNNYTTGIVEIIHAIGEALSKYFPYDAKTDTNELSDDIVFGK